METVDIKADQRQNHIFNTNTEILFLFVAADFVFFYYIW